MWGKVAVAGIVVSTSGEWLYIWSCFVAGLWGKVAVVGIVVSNSGEWLYTWNCCGWPMGEKWL